MGGTPKSSLWIGFSITNRPFLGNPIYGPPHIISQYTSITHLNFLLSKSPFLQLEEAFTTAMARSIPLRWKWVLMSETPGEPLDLSGWSIEAYIYAYIYIVCIIHICANMGVVWYLGIFVGSCTVSGMFSRFVFDPHGWCWRGIIHPLVSSKLAWKIPELNGGFSSKPCLISRGYHWYAKKWWVVCPSEIWINGVSLGWVFLFATWTNRPTSIIPPETFEATVSLDYFFELCSGNRVFLQTNLTLGLQTPETILGGLWSLSTFSEGIWSTRVF